MGHPPASATVTLFQTFYYLPKLRAHLRRIIGDCDTCQRKRRRNAYRSQGGVVQPAGLSFDVGNVVVVDLQGPLVDPCAPASDAKNWILTILDPVSFSVDYDVLNYPTTSLIINALERNFAVRGIPMVLVSDVGSTFTSASFLYFLRSWNVRSCWLPRDARGYGGFHERYHGQLLEQIRARLLDASHLPDPIPLRTIVAESVSALNRLPLYDLGGISAHELHYCRRPRYPIGIDDSDENSVTLDKLKDWLPSLCILDPQREVLHDELATMANEVATRRCSSLLNFWDLWCERSDRVRQRFEKLPLPRATLLRYKPGDLVLKFRRGSLKQQSCWSGPFRVVDSSESNTLYRLETLDGRRLRYLETVFNLRRYTPPVDNVDSYAYNPDEAPIPEAPLQDAGNDDDDLVYLNL
ncbi:gag/pol/env polyprotein, putative [Perkinsus marinus ATCC 50983]|uniref:Gag/pol/env polyprotein, putative n=1 Tax=Perkinsus marinus (strain ATCC 50983 / TXsc) TaxID=423536 RepID=C5KVC3_PERM5|nr:gag/pol/env polyprotein, putative [Perkinsus marinus ATCC 50983]EER11570.1 gag/pol/env polyprotein, putative [Perkinsus marinus ATCC 50983]|eukprot:XP_002779775.1 gag/pol/env polyprotein, putative [Perkinsus marinus ATCC 50983]